MRKTVSFLGKADAGFSCPAGHLLMIVQDHLGGEGRVAADLDGDMAPLGFEDMKRVVVDIGHRLLSLQVMVGFHVP